MKQRLPTPLPRQVTPAPAESCSLHDRKATCFLFRNPAVLMFFHIMTISFQSLCWVRNLHGGNTKRGCSACRKSPSSCRQSPAQLPLEPWLTSLCMGCTSLGPSALAFLLGTLTCVTLQSPGSPAGASAHKCFLFQPLRSLFALTFHRKCLKVGNKYLNTIKNYLYINIINTRLSNYLPPL